VSCCDHCPVLPILIHSPEEADVSPIVRPGHWLNLFLGSSMPAWLQGSDRSDLEPRYPQRTIQPVLRALETGPGSSPDTSCSL
jgi:hypothetical protein